MLIDHYELSDVFTSGQPAQGRYGAGDIEAVYDCSAVSAGQVEKVAELAGAFEDFMRRNSLLRAGRPVLAGISRPLSESRPARP